MWHEWIEALATGIGALATALLAYLTWRTLVVLRDYASDTKRLAETSIKQLESSHKQLESSREQVESSQTRFVVVVEVKADNPTVFACRLENQGSGPAMNVEGTIKWWMGGELKIPKQCIGAGASVELGYLKASPKPTLSINL